MAIRCWAAACRVHTGALVEDSVILDNCDIGRHAKSGARFWIRMCALRPTRPSATISDQDRQLYHVTETGIVVVEGDRSPRRHLLRLRLIVHNRTSDRLPIPWGRYYDARRMW